MKVATINIRSVKIHTPETLGTATDGYGGQKTAYSTTTTTGDTIITDPVSIRIFEVLELDPLNHEAFIEVVAHPKSKTPKRPLSPLSQAGGSLAGAVLSHMMDVSTVEMPRSPPLPRFPSFFLPPLPLPPIPDPQDPSPQSRSLGVIPKNRSHSTGEKDDCRGRNSLRTIMVLNKTSIVLIYSVDGCLGLKLVVSLHLDVSSGRIFLSWTTSSSPPLQISSY